MRGWLIGAIAIVGVVGIAGCGDDDDGDTETREFISVANKETEFVIDDGPRGESFGDQLGFQEELQEDGETVGTLYNRCTMYPAPDDPRMNCNATLEINGEGSVAIQGIVSFAGGDSEIAITGGTGDFTGASGTATVRVTEAAEAPLTLNIVK